MLRSAVLCALVQRPVDHLAVNGNGSPGGGGKGRADAARPGHAFGLGHEGGLHRCHLLGVDAQLGAEALAPCAQGVVAQPHRIVNGGADAVGRRVQPAQARGQHHLRTEMQQFDFRAFGVAVDAQVQRQIDAAEGQPHDARHTRDVEHLLDTARRFDDRQQVLEAGLESAADGVDAIGLGQHHTRHAGVAAQLEVVLEPRRAGGIDAHHHRHGLVQRIGQGVARAGFCCGRHRVLEVDDHRVGARGARLGVALGPVGGNEQVGAWRRACSQGCAHAGSQRPMRAASATPQVLAISASISAGVAAPP